MAVHDFSPDKPESNMLPLKSGDILAILDRQAEIKLTIWQIIGPISSTTHVRLLQWLNGKQKQQHIF